MGLKKGNPEIKESKFHDQHFESDNKNYISKNVAAESVPLKNLL